MRRDSFKYDLPEELIASHPTQDRTQSRLFYLEPLEESFRSEHRIFNTIIDCLNPNDLLVLNDTRVMKARFFAKKETGGKVEVLIERVLEDDEAWVHIKSSRSPKEDSLLHVDMLEGRSISLRVIERSQHLFKVKSEKGVSIFDVMDSVGHMPLPPYIKRSDEDADYERYQTVYSKELGAVAAPTAGLHFDEGLLEKIKNKGVNISYVTLHVGAGTFQPVRVDNVSDHIMHKEHVHVSSQVCEAIKETRKNKGRVIAVGTTAVRSLESAAQDGELAPFNGETDIFITPGFKFNVIDALITNFHLSESTLMMLVSAFSGQENIMNAYREAIAQNYRFFSYGDAMFLLPLKHS
jgi:S-adenosylmethionine:tRNA ribosyltransferase-isomerase